MVRVEKRESALISANIIDVSGILQIQAFKACHWHLPILEGQKTAILNKFSIYFQFVHKFRYSSFFMIGHNNVYLEEIENREEPAIQS